MWLVHAKLSAGIYVNHSQSHCNRCYQVTHLTTMVVYIWVFWVLHNSRVEVIQSFFLLSQLHLQTSTFNKCIRPDLHVTQHIIRPQRQQLCCIFSQYYITVMQPATKNARMLQNASRQYSPVETYYASWRFTSQQTIYSFMVCKNL